METPTDIYHFEDTRQFWAFVSKEAGLNPPRPEESAGGGWFCNVRSHVSSMAQGLQLMRKDVTHPDITARVEKLAAEAMVRLATPVAPRYTQVWGETGNDLSMERVWAGHLESSWRGKKKQPRPASPIHTIQLDAGAASFRSASHLAARGAAALVLADVLEKNNYRCEIVWETEGKWLGGSKPAQHYKFSIVLKRPDQPLDIATLAGTAASPMTFRAGVLLHGVRVLRTESGCSQPRAVQLTAPNNTLCGDEVNPENIHEFVTSELNRIQGVVQ